MGRAVRYSKKREAVLSAIQGTDCHPSAEWVYQRLKPLHPDLSLGTVYRNLTFFRENGLIQSVGVVQGQERFDSVVSPHSHFVCNCCGTVSRQYGLAVQGHKLTFYGLCSSCANTQQNFKEEPL